MSTSQSANQRLIVTHAVLTGLTPLIPIPVLDDLAKTYFQRRLVRKLASVHDQKLSEADVQTLADDRGGCLGCLGTALSFPLKLVFRKLFFFLEWKRAIDTVSRTYYHGYLVRCALEERWCAPAGPRSAAEVRAAIDWVLAQVNTSPIEQAVKASFKQSKSAVKSAARLLQRSLRRISGKPSAKDVEQAIEAIEPEEEREIESVVGRLQKAIESMPAEHFERLRAQLRAALTNRPPQP